MNLVKILIAVNWCILLGACSVSKTESDARDAVSKAISSDSGKIKFKKFTQVDEKYACYAVDTEKDVGRQYILLNSADNKWKMIRAPLVSHEKCIEEAKKEYEVVAELIAEEARQFTEENNIKNVILSHLIDPDSAKFGKIKRLKRIENGEIIERACATVNARNTYGGYTGDKVLMLKKIDNEWKSESYPQNYINDYMIEKNCFSNIAY